MKRRTFIAALGGAAAWPLIMSSVASVCFAAWLGLSILAASSDAHAQQSGKPPRIGLIVSLTSPSMVRTIPTFKAFFAALRDLGYEEGRDLVFRSAEGHMERLPGIIAELIALKVNVLVAPVCGAPLDAARQATSTVPI